MTEKTEFPIVDTVSTKKGLVNGVPQEIGHRVFVGNLSYQTRESELREFCEQVGKVIDCKIVFRGPRSMGYGFVAYEAEMDADKAITNLKDKELDTRKVNVEKAVPKEEADAQRASRPRRGGFRGRRGSSSFRGRRGFRGGRRPRAEPTGEPSKTTVFVGNLPYNVIDSDLYGIFQNFQVEKAHVVRRRNGASCGYGFVTLVSEEEQKKALAALVEVWCDERKLSVRAALSDESRGDGQQPQITIGGQADTD